MKILKEWIVWTSWKEDEREAELWCKPVSNVRVLKVAKGRCDRQSWGWRMPHSPKMKVQNLKIQLQNLGGLQPFPLQIPDIVMMDVTDPFKMPDLILKLLGAMSNFPFSHLFSLTFKLDHGVSVYRDAKEVLPDCVFWLAVSTLPCWQLTSTLSRLNMKEYE